MCWQQSYRLLHHIAMQQQVPGCINDDWDDPQRIQGFAESISRQDVQLYYQIALQGRDDLRISPQPREGFEMSLLRMMAFRPWQDATAPRPATATAQAAGAAANHRPAALPPSAAKAPPTAEPKQPSPLPSPPPLPPSAATAADDAIADWQEIYAQLGLRGGSAAVGGQLSVRGAHR